MKIIMSVLCFVALVTSSVGAAEQRSIKTIGHGSKEEIDTKGMSPRLVEGGKELKTHCTTCHSEQRIITTINEWLNTDDEHYEERLKTMMAKKIRLSNGSLHRNDSQKIFDLLLSFHKQPPPHQ